MRSWRTVYTIVLCTNALNFLNPFVPAHHCGGGRNVGLLRNVSKNIDTEMQREVHGSRRLRTETSQNDSFLKTILSAGKR